MKLEDIYHFFDKPPPIHLSRELAVCYVLNTLLKEESCGSQLVKKLTDQCPKYRLSDSVLYGALKFLEEHGVIQGDWRKLKGRGRPRKMYRILPEQKAQAEELAALWRTYINQNVPEN